jgi:hypothetical protein
VGARRKGKYTKNPRRDREIIAAIDAGVMAAAEKYREEVIEYWISEVGFGVNGHLGYTPEGMSATGTASDIKIGPIERRKGKRVADVYSPGERDGEPYPAFWELGHNNKFTNQKEEQPIFGPALFFGRDNMIDAMAKQIRASWTRGERYGEERMLLRPKSGMIRVSEP